MQNKKIKNKKSSYTKLENYDLMQMLQAIKALVATHVLYYIYIMYKSEML